MGLRAVTLATIGALCAAASAPGASFTVTNTNDSGSGSLRKAVTDANASPDGDTITFALPATPTPTTISLSSDLDAITSPTLVFVAPASPVLTIDGNDKVVFQNGSTSHAVTFDGDVTYDTGKFLFTEASTGTIDGILNGDDVDFTKSGAGTTTLLATGQVDLDTASDVNVDAGTLAVDGTLSGGPLGVDSGATLAVGGVVNVTDLTAEGAVDVGGQLTASSLAVASTGTLVADGSVDVANAVTDHGTVFVNGALTAGSLIVESDGALAGNGGTVVAPVTVAGRVAPDTSSGNLAINGPVAFASTSTYQVDIGPGGTGDSLSVTGAVTIDPGAQLVLVADPDAIGTSSSVTVLNASGGINGQFTSTDYAFFQEDLDYQANSLTVTLTSTGQSFTPFATTPNQSAVAQLLDAALPTATGDLATVFDSLKTVQASEVGPLLDAIGGESLTAFATARQILGERTARALHRRTRDIARGEGRAFYLSGPPKQGDERPLLDRVRPGAWLDALGTFGQLDGDRGEADVDTLLYGGTLGADAVIAERVVLGLAAGYARSDVDLDHRDADVFGDTVQGALYGGFIDPRGFVSAYGRYAYTFEKSTRRIDSSALSRHAHANWDAQDYGVGGEAGVTVVSIGGFALQPIAGVDWLRLTEESYTENDAGSLGLIVDPETLDTTTAHYGARVFGRLDMARTGVLVPELRAFYQHAYGDRERVLNARLSGAPGLGSIGVRGPALPRDSGLFGVGWGVEMGDLTVSFDYDAVVGRDRVEHQGTVAARILF
jgi:uncharacterized protein with beta-barrel porin domain